METTWILRTDLPHKLAGSSGSCRADATADPLETWLKKISLRFICFDEIGKQGAKKEHQHIVLVTSSNKKDTLRHQLTAAFPQLKAKRKGSGGETLYSIDKYDPDKDWGYKGFRLHYVCKDGNHRCGDLWSTDEWVAHREKRKNYVKENAHPPKKEKKATMDELLRRHLNNAFIENPLEQLYPETYERVLALEIYKYYRKYGKANNRNWIKVAAEQLLFYAPVYAPTEKAREVATGECLKAIMETKNAMVYQ